MDESLYTDGGRGTKLSVSFNLPDKNGFGKGSLKKDYILSQRKCPMFDECLPGQSGSDFQITNH